MDNTEDADLVAALTVDDGVALKRLFDLHSLEVYAYARALVWRHDDAEEIVQQTFLSLWKQRGRLETYTGSALPWLLVTARYHAKNLLRMRGRHEARLTDLKTIEDVDSGLAAEDLAVAEEARRELDSALKALTPLERQIFALCVEEDLLYKEAAARLGITHGAVRNRLGRIRQQLQARLISGRDLPNE